MTDQNINASHSPKATDPLDELARIMGEDDRDIGNVSQSRPHETEGVTPQTIESYSQPADEPTENRSYLVESVTQAPSGTEISTDEMMALEDQLVDWVDPGASSSAVHSQGTVYQPISDQVSTPTDTGLNPEIVPSMVAQQDQQPSVQEIRQSEPMQNPVSHEFVGHASNEAEGYEGHVNGIAQSLQPEQKIMDLEAQLMAELGYSTPDPEPVSATSSNHSEHQVQLDPQAFDGPTVAGTVQSGLDELNHLAHEIATEQTVIVDETIATPETDFEETLATLLQGSEPQSQPVSADELINQTAHPSEVLVENQVFVEQVANPIDATLADETHVSSSVDAQAGLDEVDLGSAFEAQLEEEFFASEPSLQPNPNLVDEHAETNAHAQASTGEAMIERDISVQSLDEQLNASISQFQEIAQHQQPNTEPDLESEFESAFAAEMELEHGSSAPVSSISAATQADLTDPEHVDLRSHSPEMDAHAGILDDQGVEDQKVGLIPSVQKPFIWASGAIAIALAIGAGTVGYSYWKSNPAGGEPVVITAEAGAFKEKPEEPGGKTIPNQDQPVYNRLDNSDGETIQQTRLVNTTDNPVEVADVVSEDQNQNLRSMQVQTSAKNEDRLSVVNSGEAKNTLPTVLQPRKVKTVTVRADGTIVQSAEQELKNQLALVTEEASPAVEENTETSVDGAVSNFQVPIPTLNPLKGADITNTTQKATDAGEVKTRSLVAKNTTNRQEPSQEVKPNIVKVKTITVKPNLDTVKVASNAESQQVSERKPVTKTTNVNRPFAVQLSSQRSAESAEASYQNLKRRFGSLLNGVDHEVSAGKVEGKGTFYRVRLPMVTRSDALDFCSRYKKAGGSCFVTR